MIRCKIERVASLTSLSISTRSAREPPRMRRQFSSGRSLAPLVLGLCIWLFGPRRRSPRRWSASSTPFPASARPPSMSTPAAASRTSARSASARSPRSRACAPGSFRWTPEGRPARCWPPGTSTVGNGVYDIVILDKPSGRASSSGIYKAAGAKPGTSLVRVIHAVPELGSPMFMLDMHTLANRLPYVTGDAVLLGHARRLRALGDEALADEARRPDAGGCQGRPLRPRASPTRRSSSAAAAKLVRVVRVVDRVPRSRGRSASPRWSSPGRDERLGDGDRR